MRHVASRSTGIIAPAGTDKEGGIDGEGAIVGETEEERLESLYEQIAWPVGKKYGHPYDAFKLALTYVNSYLSPFDGVLISKRSEPDQVFGGLPPIPPATLAFLQATIARRLTPQPIKLRADIELTCYQPSGIDAIKKALRAGEQVGICLNTLSSPRYLSLCLTQVSTETVPIRAKLVAPPLYVLGTNATDKVSTP